ncbi:hypothetical protein P879_02169 [Paragonimus westermani]|uniref:Ketoreductase domain-containing protein n=1 Tax=Paragonimus westermani TaxID=34504 RepID=A0A8T0DCF8_9TREM|nr:hypothetical protein P879_02169 [Paragonimus westermani]
MFLWPYFFFQILILVVTILVIWALCAVYMRSFQRVDPPKLAGYNVLITGGSSGIGFSLAEMFHRCGATVTLVARNQTRLQLAQSKLMESGAGVGEVHILSLDLCGCFSSLQNELKDHVARNGPVDVLVNCAGYAVSRTFVDTPPEAIECMIRTNYLSAVHVTKILLPDMLCDKTRPSCDRRIAFVCSMAGQTGVYGLAAYSGSKYALRGFAEVLRMELELSGPLVTLAFPPDTDTPGLAAENVGKPDVTREISAAGGLAKPDQVASSIFKAILTGVFVCSYGIEGTALSWATAGLLPPLGIGNGGEQTTLGLVASTVIEVLAAGPLRAFGIGYALWMRHIVRKHERSKQTT